MKHTGRAIQPPKLPLPVGASKCEWLRTLSNTCICELRASVVSLSPKFSVLTGSMGGENGARKHS